MNIFIPGIASTGAKYGYTLCKLMVRKQPFKLAILNKRISLEGVF